MKKLNEFFHWFSAILLVAGFIALYYFEDALPLTQSEHTLIAVGLLLVLLIVLFSWIDHNEANFIVSQDTLEKMSAKCEKQKKLEQK